MKKKSVRKVSSAKKVISKIPLKKKKSFTLRSWLLGGLVLLVASAYGLYQYNLQPKGLKVLELSGDIFDYIIPEPATINEICGGSCGLDATGKVTKPKTTQSMAVSTSDTLRDIAAKIEITAKETVKKEYKSNPDYTETEQVEKVVQELTKNLQNNNSGVTFKDLVNKDETGKAINSEETKAVDAKLKDIATTITKETKDKLILSNSDTPNIPQSPGSVNSSNTCSTSAFSVYEGETVIGNVTSDHTSNEIRGCHNGSWILVCTDTNSTIQAPAAAAGFTSCSVSVPPIYKQPELGKGPNCYTEGGSIVVGNGSVVDGEDGSGKQCRGTKDLVDVTKYNGQWLTGEEIKEKKDQEAAKAAMEKREKDKKSCEDNKGTYVIERGEGSCAPNMAYEKCIKSGSGYEWNSSSNTCVEKKAHNNNSAVYNNQDDCVDSIVDSKKETCRQSPNGSTYIRIPLTSGTSTTSQYVGGVYKSLDECDNNLPSGQTCRQAPNGTSWTRFTTSTTNNSPNTPIYEGGSYGSETECENANPGKSCRQSPNGSTWAVFSLTQTNFGNTTNANQNNTDSNAGNSNLDAANKGREAGEKAAKNKKNLTEWCIRDAECGSGYCDNSAFFWNWQCKTPNSPTSNSSIDLPTNRTNRGDVSDAVEAGKEAGERAAAERGSSSTETNNSDSNTPSRYNPTAGQPSNTSAGTTTTFNVVDWIKSWFAPSNNKEKVSQTDKLKDNAEGRQCYLASEGDDACSKCPDVVGEELNYGYDSNRPNSFAATFCLK